MATPVPTSPITVKKRTTARRGLFQSDGDASDATTSSEERSLSEEEEEEPTTPLAPSEPSSAPTSPRDEDLARAEMNARDAADAEAKSDARLAALDESWAAQEATIQLLEARATRRWKDAREANERKQAAMERLAANEARRDLAQARAADARQAAQAARLEAAEAAAASADAKVQTARLEERVAAAAAKPEAVPAPPPPVPPDATVQKQRARALADARVLAEEHDRLRFAVEKAEARLAAATEAADVREKIGAMATAQSDAKAREAIAAVRQLRDVVRDGDPRALAAKLAAAARRRPRRTAPPASPVTAPVAAPPAPAPVAAPAPAPPDVTVSGDDGSATLNQTDDATAGSATLADVYEELGETDFDALETALRKCDADEEDIAAVHAVLDRAGRKEEVGDYSCNKSGPYFRARGSYCFRERGSDSLECHPPLNTPLHNFSRISASQPAFSRASRACTKVRSVVRVRG